MSHAGRRGLGTGESRAIQYRREADQRMHDMHTTQKADARRAFISDWQAKSGAAVERIQISNMAKDLEIAAEKQVELRRQKLAELLRGEDADYAREIAAVRETTSDKLARNLQLAKQQQQQREERRREFAQQQTLRMWRAGCDDLRTLDSEAYDRYVREQQLKQRDEKRTKSADQVAEERAWVQLWEDDRLQKLERDKEEAARRAIGTAETRAAVLQQMQEREAERAVRIDAKAREREEWRARAEAEAAAAERQRKEQNQRITEQGRRIAQWNDDLIKQKRDAKQARETEERVHMEAQLADHQEQLQRKQVTMVAMQREMIAYSEFLRARREEELREQAQLEGAIAEHLAQGNARQDAIWERERRARESLLAQVRAEQGMQIQHKQDAKRQAEEAKVAERAELEAAIKRDAEAAAAEQQEARLRDLQRRVELELQIRQKANVRALQQAQLRQDEEAARVAELQYRRFVQAELHRPRELGVGARNLDHTRPEF